MQRDVCEILERERLLDHIPRSNKVVVSIGKAITQGTLVCDAHGRIWKAHYVGGLRALRPFPKRNPDDQCPSHIRSVFVDCVVRTSGGMGSFYGFEGFFVSLLIDLDQRVIWDARGEPAH